MLPTDLEHTSPLILGVRGLELSGEERALFSQVNPFGFILFARNVSDRGQVAALVQSLKACCAGHDAIVFIDQEGGRVARLTPPDWPIYPPAAIFSDLYAVNEIDGVSAAYANARLIADDLNALGIHANCLPVLDVQQPGAHDVIGDRSFGASPEVVIALGKAVCDGLLDGGVLPVIKHIPGHGRANCDSHVALPRVTTDLQTLNATDFEPFRALASMPLAMTAHVVYEAVDPQLPATFSATVINDVIRGKIGFDGALMSDDLSMEALDGSLGERAARAQAAGCDLVLHCNGNLEEMQAVAAALSQASATTLERLELVYSWLRVARPFDREGTLADRDRRLSRVIGT